MTEVLTFERAHNRLNKLVGTDLRPLADEYDVTVFRDDKLNKGWIGQVMERHLGFELSSLQAPNGGDWELKVVSLRANKKGGWRVKETMQITMISSTQPLIEDFESSFLYHKLRRMVVCGREFVDMSEPRARLLRVVKFDILSPENRDVLTQVKEDYELVRQTIETRGFDALTGKMGILVQPRTKGSGHGSKSRAFYARTGFVARILGFN